MNQDKKNKIFLLILIIILISLMFYITRFILLEIYWRNKATKYAEEIYEKNKEPIFEISKIINYSSAEAIDNSETLQDFDISQYSDFAIFINNHSKIEELTEENTVKELYIDNFKIKLPENNTGNEQNIYYKNPYNMGKFRKYDYNKIEDKLEYDIIYKNNDNKEEFYNTPIFFTDCTNPISLSYINDNIYTDYSVEKNSTISYDGRVLKDIDINLEDITPRISFTIHLKNNLNEEFICNVAFNVNLENEEGSIYSGYFVEITEGFDKQYKFFKL